MLLLKLQTSMISTSPRCNQMLTESSFQGETKRHQKESSRKGWETISSGWMKVTEFMIIRFSILSDSSHFVCANSRSCARFPPVVWLIWTDWRSFIFKRFTFHPWFDRKPCVWGWTARMLVVKNWYPEIWDSLIDSKIDHNFSPPSSKLFH
jgi:hypothetical protein